MNESKWQIVKGQKVTEGKVLLARQMREEMTPTEAVLWEHLRGNRLAGLKFRRQQVIDGFIADFYCHAAGLVVEVDGPIHNPAYDAERDRILGIRQLTVLRITNEQVEAEIEAVLEQIKSTAQAKISPFPARNERLGEGQGERLKG
jgi:very-short-patch-repair endonuclease